MVRLYFPKPCWIVGECVFYFFVVPCLSCPTKQHQPTSPFSSQGLPGMSKVMVYLLNTWPLIAVFRCLSAGTMFSTFHYFSVFQRVNDEKPSWELARGPTNNEDMLSKNEYVSKKQLDATTGTVIETIRRSCLPLREQNSVGTLAPLVGHPFLWVKCAEVGATTQFFACPVWNCLIILIEMRLNVRITCNHVIITVSCLYTYTLWNIYIYQ